MQRSVTILVIIALFILVILLLGLTPILRKPVAPTTTAVEAVAQPVATPMPSLPITESDQIIDLFEPSSDALQQQRSTSDITKQIENAMIVSYTLMHCNLMTQAEYSDTFNALITYSLRNKLEPDAARAEAHVRAIASAAAGGYTMVYGNTPCSDPSLPDKSAELTRWRTSILKPGAPAR